MNFLSRYDKDTQDIIRNKRAAPPVSRLKHTEKRTILEALLIKISVITGWIVPVNPYKEILLNTFEEVLSKEYPHLNHKEIEAAFLKFGTKIPDYGKEMNLSLFTAVLDQYRDQRREAERNASLAAENALKIDPLTDEQMINKARGEIQFYYNQRLKGNNRPIIYSYWKEILMHDKFMREDQEVSDFFDFCLEKKVKNIYIYEPPVGKYEYKHYDNQDLPF